MLYLSPCMRYSQNKSAKTLTLEMKVKVKEENNGTAAVRLEMFTSIYIKWFVSTILATWHHTFIQKSIHTHKRIERDRVMSIGKNCKADLPKKSFHHYFMFFLTASYTFKQNWSIFFTITANTHDCNWGGMSIARASKPLQQTTGATTPAAIYRSYHSSSYLQELPLQQLSTGNFKVDWSSSEWQW